MDLIRVADMWEENQEYLKQRLGRGDSERFGAYFVLMPESPFPRFNHASRIRLGESQVDDLLAECRRYFRQNGLPTCCLLVTPATRPLDLSSRLYRLGFACENNPVMIWDGTPIRPGPAEVRVERAGRERAGLVYDTIRRVFFPSASESALAMARRGVETSYELDATNYLAYIGPRLVGAGMLFRRGGMGGIYNMCTLPEARGQGVARTVLATAVADALAAGCEYVGLTPTEMGRPLYERVGFVVAYQERYFVEHY